MLFLILTFPLFGSLLVSVIEKRQIQLKVSLFSAAITFLISLGLWLAYQGSFLKFQTTKSFLWFDLLNLNFLLGVDAISLIFVILTTFLFFLCFISLWQSLKFQVKSFLIAFLIMESILIGVFLVSDLLVFYVLFESALVPMFFLIGLGGSRERKVRAGYLFVIYTVVGSALMLLAIIFLEARVGSCSFTLLQTFCFSTLEEKILWIAFFFAFASKIPMMPFHVWLPEAHVEAPTTGSVILAGILLKLGSYGLLRISLGIFGKVGVFFSPIVGLLGLVGLLYSSFTAIRQTDLKRIIAYTSIAHMNLVVLGLFSNTVVGIEGAIFQSLSHGFVSSALFFCVGVVYDRYHSRLLAYYGGVSFFMPRFVLFFFVFNLANIAMPGTSSFVGEFLLLLGLAKMSIILCFFSGFSMVLSAVYSLWLFNRLAFGNYNYSLKPMKDIVLRESFVFFNLSYGVFFFGIYTKPVMEEMHFNVISNF